jgi:hypothetical protein
MVEYFNITAWIMHVISHSYEEVRELKGKQIGSLRNVRLCVRLQLVSVDIHIDIYIDILFPFHKSTNKQ